MLLLFKGFNAVNFTYYVICKLHKVEITLTHFYIINPCAY